MTTDLISRLERGRWDGDNAEVLKALGWMPGTLGVSLFGPDGHEYMIADSLFGGLVRGMPKPLDDMNAALRLVPLPWRSFTAFNDPDGGWAWSLYLDDGSPPTTVDGRGPTAAIALCIAILKAKETEDV